MKKHSAYNNDENLRKWLIEESWCHAKADAYIQKHYGDAKKPLDEFKGCSMGCTAASINERFGLGIFLSDHDGLAKFLNIPQFIVRLQEQIFEALPKNKFNNFTPRLYESIKCGVDLSPVLPKYLKFILEKALSYEDKRYSDQIEDKRYSDQIKDINSVIDVLNRWIETGFVDEDIAYADSLTSPVARASARASAYAARAADAATGIASALASVYADDLADLAGKENFWLEVSEEFLKIISECE